MMNLFKNVELTDEQEAILDRVHEHLAGDEADQKTNDGEEDASENADEEKPDTNA